MIDQEFNYEDSEESEPKEPDTKEILSKEVVKRDPNYFYFIDSDGNVCRKARSSKRKTIVKKQIINYFDKVNLTVPKVMIDGYISKKFKTVRRTGPNGGMIWVPPIFVGKTFQVILIPKEDWIVSQIR